MKKNLIKSLIVSVSIEVIGALINLISYFLRGEFLLAQELYGGEWQGWRGFGLILNRVYPLFPVSEPFEPTTWISFDYASLHVTLVGGFLISFVIFHIIYVVKKDNQRNKLREQLR